MHVTGKRCGQPVTLAGSIGETLFHAPVAMFYHWNMIQNDRKSMLMPFFASYEIMYNHQNLSKKVGTGLRI